MDEENKPLHTAAAIAKRENEKFKREGQRRHIRAKRSMLCTWHGCTEPPIKWGKPYCARHAAEAKCRY